MCCKPIEVWPEMPEEDKFNKYLECGDADDDAMMWSLGRSMFIEMMRWPSKYVQFTVRRRTNSVYGVICMLIKTVLMAKNAKSAYYYYLWTICLDVCTSHNRNSTGTPHGQIAIVPLTWRFIPNYNNNIQMSEMTSKRWNIRTYHIVIITSPLLSSLSLYVIVVANRVLLVLSTEKTTNDNEKIRQTKQLSIIVIGINKAKKKRREVFAQRPV